MTFNPNNPSEVQAMERVMGEAMQILHLNARNKAAGAAAAYQTFLDAPAYLRQDVPPETVLNLQAQASRWRREADWLQHRPRVLLPFELCLIPVHELPDAGDVPYNALAASIGTHAPIVGLVVAEA